MADHIVIVTAVVLVLSFSRVEGLIIECEDETLNKTVTASKTGIAHATFCVEISPTLELYAETPLQHEFCLAHHLCAERYLWWWEVTDRDLDVYTIHVQIRGVRAKGGGEFPIRIFTNRFSDSLLLSVTVTDLKTKDDSQSDPSTIVVPKDPPAECKSALSRYTGKNPCPGGWLPVGNGVCVMPEVGAPVNFELARDTCAKYGGSIVQVQSDSSEGDKRRKRGTRRVGGAGHIKRKRGKGEKRVRNTIKKKRNIVKNEVTNKWKVEMNGIRKNKVAKNIEVIEKKLANNTRVAKKRKAKIVGSTTKRRVNSARLVEKRETDNGGIAGKGEVRDVRNKRQAKERIGKKKREADEDSSDDDEDEEDGDDVWGDDEDEWGDEEEDEEGDHDEDDADDEEGEEEEESDQYEDDEDEDDEKDDDVDNNKDISEGGYSSKSEDGEEDGGDELESDGDDWDNDEDDSNTEDESDEDEEEDDDESTGQEDGDFDEVDYDYDEDMGAEDLDDADNDGTKNQSSGDDDGDDDDDDDDDDKADSDENDTDDGVDDDSEGDDDEDDGEDDYYDEDGGDYDKDDDSEEDREDEDYDDEEDENEDDRADLDDNGAGEELSDGVIQEEDDNEADSDVDEKFQGVEKGEDYIIDPCLKARLADLAGTNKLWVTAGEDDTRCLVYNAATGVLEEEQSCQYLYNRFSCLLDVSEYRAPTITHFGVHFMRPNGLWSNSSLHVHQNGTVYHDITDDVDSVKIECEADGWPAPEAVIIEFNGGEEPTLRAAPHRHNVSEIAGAFLGKFTCAAGNIFGDETKISDLQLFRHASLVGHPMIVGGTVFLVVFCVAAGSFFIIHKAKICRGGSSCSPCACPWGMFSLGGRTPTGASRLASEVFPASLDYVYGDDGVWGDDIPLYVRQGNKRKSPATGNIYNELKAQEQTEH